MNHAPGFSRLSPDEIRLLRTPAFARVRDHWLDWLSLAHGVLAPLSPTAARAPLAGPEAGALLEATLARLQGTPFHLTALRNTRVLDEVRRLGHDAEPGGGRQGLVEAYLDAVLGEYAEVTAPRHGPWAAGPARAAETPRDGRGPGRPGPPDPA